MFKKLTAIILVAAFAVSVSACGKSDNSSAAAEIIEDIQTVQAFKEDAVPEEDVTKILNAGVNAPSAMNTQPWHFTAVTEKAILEEISNSMSFGAPSASKSDKGSLPEGFSLPDGFDKDKIPSKFDKDNMPEDFSKPEKFDKDNMPEGFDPSNMPEGFDKDKLPENFDPENRPSRPSGSPDKTKATETDATKVADETKPADETKEETKTAKAGITDAPLVIVVSCKEGSEFDAGLAAQNMCAEANLLGYGTKIMTSTTMALNGEKKDDFKTLLGIPEDQSAVCVILVGVADTEAYDAVSSATERNEFDSVVTIK